MSQILRYQRSGENIKEYKENAMNAEIGTTVSRML